jgi:hypothetical protein
VVVDVNVHVQILFFLLLFFFFAWQNVGLGEVSQCVRAMGQVVGVFADIFGICLVVLQALDAVNQSCAGVEDDQTGLAVVPELKKLLYCMPALQAVIGCPEQVYTILRESDGL